MSSLPERPNLGHLRKQAKELLRQYHANDPTALAAFRQYLPAAKDKSAADLNAMPLGLRDAQSCIARQHGFPSWSELKHYVEGLRLAAQTSTSTEAEKVARQRYDRAQRAYEQARPRTAVPFESRTFDKYVGYYQLARSPSTFAHIFRDGDRFFEQLNTEKRLGVRPVEFFPESETKCFTTRVAAQISFVADAQGRATCLVFHQNGYESPATRVDRSVVDRYEAALEQRLKDSAPGPGTEAFLRHYIVGCEKGDPNYEDMSPPLAAAVRRIQPTIIAKRHQRVGAFKALAFKGVDRRGWDVYEATFTQGQVEYRIAPLNADGKAISITPRELP
ncbi:MAG TPA: hypothetical protein VK727_08115 [Steroidobacteraceae bacterium]|nr:hypothetical protein [Steroidobacteraceae bacterium]